MESLVERLKKRAEIRRQITTRKSVQEGAPDRIADLLEEAASEIEAARASLAEERKRLHELTKDRCPECIREALTGEGKDVNDSN